MTTEIEKAPETVARDDAPASLEAVAPLVVGALRGAGHTLAVAESCTGGLLGATVTSVPGASDVFWGGVISYDDAAKRRLLGVEAETLRRHGAVSEATAEEMARGVRDLAGTTWSLAVTGIAGPDGGTSEKPVGTVWIGLDGPHGGVRRFRFEGGRDAVREASVRAALTWLEKEIGRWRRAAGNGASGPDDGDDRGDPSEP